jgi:hypothetical protein
MIEFQSIRNSFFHVKPVSKFGMVFLLMLLKSAAFSFEIKRIENRIFLTDKTCPSVKKLILDIKSWTEHTDFLNEKTNCDIDSLYFEQTSNACSFDITTCVPEHVKKFQDSKPLIEGPNCWNLSLVITEIIPVLRYTSPNEMSYYMRSPLCRQISDQDQKQPGDIGAIRTIKNQKITEYHGFIYISDKISYSKNGYQTTNGYSLQSLDSIFKLYDVPNKKQCRKNEISVNTKCSFAVSYFRCSSFEDYLNHLPESSWIIVNFFIQLKSFELLLQEKTFNKTQISIQAEKDILFEIENLVQFLKLQTDPKYYSLNLTDQNLGFILNSLHLRLYGLSYQLANTKDNQLSNKVFEYMQEIRILKSSFLLPN